MKRSRCMNWGGDEGGCYNQQVWEPIIFPAKRREHRNQGL